MGGAERSRIGAGSQLDVIAVDHRVVLDERVVDLVVAIDRRIRHAVHDDQCAAETVPGQAVQVIVADDLAFVDDTDATGVIDPVAEKNIVLDQIVVAVSQRQRAARLKETGCRGRRCSRTCSR